MSLQQIDEQLIGALYGTAVQEGDWRPALERLCNLLNSCEAALPIGTMPDFRQVETTGRVLNSESTGRYARCYGRFDPKTNIFARKTPGYLFNDARHFDNRFVDRNGFSQEYSRTLGTRHTLDMLAERTASREIYLAVMRPSSAGPYAPESEILFRRASGHFVRALALKEHLDCLHQAGDALDSLEFGVVVVDSVHRVRLLNRAAESRLTQEGEILLSKGVLSAGSPAQERKLHALIDAAASGRTEGGSMKVPDRGGGMLTLRVAPLPASRRLVPCSPAVLVLICAESKFRLGPSELAALYGLTEAESCVAIALAQGATLSVVAARRGIKYSTVRSQLLSVMGKLGVHRQADVARLLVSATGRMV